ncbi:DUF4258 domain-containing protein [Bdellovibrionota bacterium FG-2]
MKAVFRGHHYVVIFTNHAQAQMVLRGLDEAIILEVIENGEIKEKDSKNKFWVFKTIGGRRDNMVAVSVAIEAPRLIVITAMVHWRPK